MIRTSSGWAILGLPIGVVCGLGWVFLWTKVAVTDPIDESAHKATYFAVVDNVIIDERKGTVDLRIREPDYVSRFWLSMEVPLDHHAADDLKKLHGHRADVTVEFE